MNLMKCNFYKIFMTFSFVFLVIGNNRVALAEEINNYQKISPENIYLEGDKAKLKYDFDKANNSLEIKVNSIGLEEGYYTSNLYSKGKYDWSNFGMISFNAQNNSQEELKFNFSVVKTDGTFLSVNEDKSVLIKNENNQDFEKLSPAYGTINIPSGFNGVVYVPFTSLNSKSGDNNQHLFSNISSWGISITTEENKEKDIHLSNFALIAKDDPFIKYGDLNFKIEGDDRVQIPVQGEAISIYKASLNKDNVIYSLAEDYEGVSIDKSGKLTLNTSVNVEKIKIEAKYEYLMVKKEIQLYKSWTLGAKEIDGTSKSIPGFEEVKNLMGGIYPLIMSQRFIDFIRAIWIVFVLIFSGLYIFWSRKKNIR